jgi:hypothetical protein
MSGNALVRSNGATKSVDGGEGGEYDKIRMFGAILTLRWFETRRFGTQVLMSKSFFWSSLPTLEV